MDRSVDLMGVCARGSRIILTHCHASQILSPGIGDDVFVGTMISEDWDKVNVVLYCMICHRNL